MTICYLLLVLWGVVADVTSAQLTYSSWVIQHGHRYPVNDLYDGTTDKNLAGELTSVGLRQMYLLGSYLKQKYVVEQRLFTAKYNDKLVQVNVLSSHRTGDSGAALCYGLFAVGDGPRIPSEAPKDLFKPPFTSFNSSSVDYQSTVTADSQLPLQYGYQAVPLNKMDSIFNNCPSYGVLLTQRLREVSNDLSQFQLQHTPLIAKIKLVFNLTALQSTISGMSDLYDTLMSDLALGRKIPTSLDQYDLKELKFISNYYNILAAAGDLGRTMATPFLRLLSVRLQNSVYQKVSAYIVQPSNINWLLTTLNLTSSQCLQQIYRNQSVTSLNCGQPNQPASTLIFEQYQDQSYEYQIGITYNSEPMYLCARKVTRCPQSQFLSRLSASLAADYDKSCGVKLAIHSTQ